MLLDAVDGAEAAAEVFEFADGAFDVDGVAEREGVHGLAHLAAGLGGRVRGGGEVEFDEDVEVARAGDFGDGRVGADDGFAVDGVPEADHEVLPHGETERLFRVLEGEGEDDGVGGDGPLGVEDGFGPGAGVEEGGAGFGGGGFRGGFGEGELGGVGEGAEVVGGHHAFCCFRVDGHELVRGVEAGGAQYLFWGAGVGVFIM